jgi:hypothetical protein
MLPRIIKSNLSKSRVECLQILFDKLQRIQQAILVDHQSENSLQEQIISTCQGIEECSLALYNPIATVKGVYAQLQSAIGIAICAWEMAQFN